VNRGVLLAGAAGVLVAACVAIWLGTRGGEDAPATPGSAAQQTGATPVEGKRGTTVTPAPELRGGDPASSGDGVTTYQVDTVTIHDHRGANAGQRLDLPPNLHPPGGRRIPPTLTGAFASQVRTVLAECARSLPAEARGPRPRVEGDIIIAITGGKASVTRSLMQLRDVQGDVDAIRQCVEQKATGLTADAAGQDDLEGYAIHVQFPILQ
jgi:hypothetical protein